jgi:hypothetical protein
MTEARDGEDAIQRAVAAACLGRDAAFALDLRRFLEAHGVAAEDVEAISAAPARLGVYRILVRNGLSNVVARVLPRTRARLNGACPERFDRDFAAFVDEVGPRTHYLRDVPGELLAWARPRWRADAAVPAYLPDFAAFELAAFGVGAAPDAPRDAALGEIALDRSIAIHPSAVTLHSPWAVHELSADLGAAEAPAEREVHLLGYRDAEHAARWLELTPLAAAIVERLIAGEPLRAAVADAHEAQRAAYDANAVAALLADLAARGVVMGGRSA